MIELREGQQQVLAYQGGLMAVSAVPGSGKTFTLTRLAVELVLNGRLDPDAGQQVLIVTYLNSSVDTFKKGIRNRLAELGHEPDAFEGAFDVRTLHSLGLEILRFAGQGDEFGRAVGLDVTDEVRSSYFLAQAIDGWIDLHEAAWETLLPEQTQIASVRFRSAVSEMADAFIRTAKNARFLPDDIEARLADHAEVSQQMPWMPMLAGIYRQYQNILHRQEAFDFNDLILQAVREVQARPELADLLRRRWPYILEDEAQDSVPLQEILLLALAGENGNLVRVGDPNQAITSSFTSAHPRYFREFAERSDVHVVDLPESGRSAPIVYETANHLVRWTTNRHPLPEVQEHAFRPQFIRGTGPDDAQQNPSQVREGIRIKVYSHRQDEELPAVAKLARQYAEKYPEQTVAVLSPTHRIGHGVAAALDGMRVKEYDNLLRGGARLREVAQAIHAMLRLLSDPLPARNWLAAYQALAVIDHPVTLPPLADGAEQGRFEALLRSLIQPELLSFQDDGSVMVEALPPGIAQAQDVDRLARFGEFMKQVFALRPLPVADLTMTLSDLLFASYGLEDEANLVQHERDLDVAYQIALVLQRWNDSQPEWRLPELAQNLEGVAKGWQRLVQSRSPNENEGYEPRPGWITLATQHSAKGMEWDAVFLVGVDGRWVPGDLEGYFQGGLDILDGVNPVAETIAQLRALMEEDAEIYPGRSSTEAANIDVICERLRLLYVGITRARRFLQISRSRQARRGRMDSEREPATAMAAIYEFLKEWTFSHSPIELGEHDH